MGIAQRRRGGIPPDKGREIQHHGQDLSPEILQAVPVQDQVCIVGDIAAGGPQMDDAGRRRGCQPVSIHMGHDVVADFLFPLFCSRIVDIGHMGFQLRHLLRRNGQAQIMLRPCQFHPQPPPGLEPHIRGKQVQHIPGRIAGSQWGFIRILAHKCSSPLRILHRVRRKPA